MTTCRATCLLLAALAGACGIEGGAQAAPPLNRLATQLAQPTDAKPAPIAVRAPRSRLDLAPPASEVSLFEHPAAAVFPAGQRRALTSDSSNLPSLGSASPGRIMSRPEMLARNFKREGLPLARLFQSENSLVHVGLNPKGKPGLWFVEKLH